MLIDFHTHVYPDDIAKITMKKLILKQGKPLFSDGTAADARRKLSAAGISLAVVQNIATKASSCDDVNTFAKNLQDDFFISFATVHPDNADNETRIANLRDEGFRGIKMHPYFQNFFVAEPKMFPIYDAISQSGLPLVIHSGFDPFYPERAMSEPKDIALIHREFPKLKLVAAHLGGMMRYSDAMEYILGQDIYIDISLSNYICNVEEFSHAINKHNSDMILFGSDSPWNSPLPEKEYVMNADISDDVREKIFYINAQKLLGI